VRQVAKEKDMTLTLSLVLALIALVCGILMLVAGRWSKWPLAAIAIICLALNQSGLIKM
jgi:ABC-type amino acid transport system permease subunit